MQLLMSAGIIQPGGDQQDKLAALAETARAAAGGAAPRRCPDSVGEIRRAIRPPPFRP